MRVLWTGLAAGVLMLAGLPAIAPAASVPDSDWRATWGVGLHGADEHPDGPSDTSLGLVVGGTFFGLRAKDQTTREIIRTSIGGQATRIRISNRFGDGPLTLGHVTLGAHASGPAVATDTLRTVTFGGKAGITIPAGKDVTSDSISMAVGAGQELAVSMHVIGTSPRLTMHLLSLTDSFESLPNSGDETADVVGNSFLGVHRQWFWLAGVDVLATHETGAVVALGDSITDGAFIENSQTETKDESWPSRLAVRLGGMPAARYARGVVNAGIAGNTAGTFQLNEWFGPPATERFDHDVLGATGVTHLIIATGSNDLGGGDSAEVVATSLKALATRAHAAGLGVTAATITPRQDGNPDFGGWTPAKEVQRAALNEWIRHYAGFDHVIDFDAVMGDPSDPTKLRRDYDSGDQLHPNAVGRQAMADAVDLGDFRCTVAAPTSHIARVSDIAGRLRVRGTSAVTRCGGKPVERVGVMVSRSAGHHRCRFLTAHGRVSAPRSCAKPLLLTATGTSDWKLSVRAHLPGGRYRVAAQAVAALAESPQGGALASLRVTARR